MKFLVTGGAGFIGSNIVEHLVKDLRHEVVVLDNLFSTNGSDHNIKPFLKDITFIKGDITNPEDLELALEGVDCIFHQAAIPSVPRSIAYPEITNCINITGTLKLLVTASDFGVKRIIMAGSSSVYGDTPVLPKVETMPVNPMSPYAVQKAADEMYFKVWAGLYNIETVVLRYFNVFGPRQDPNSHYSAVIPKFIKRMHLNNRPFINGDGEHSRDFTYIDNVVYANMLASIAPAEKVSGKVFNIACNSSITLNELVAKINKIMRKDIKPIHGDSKPGDVKYSLADISRAKECLGYSPIESFDKGLEKTIKHLIYRAFREKYLRNGVNKEEPVSEYIQW